MKYVLAYQKKGDDGLDKRPIPEGMEDVMDDVITKSKIVRFKDGLELLKDEIKGIFSEGDFERFRHALFEPVYKLPPMDF